MPRDAEAAWGQWVMARCSIAFALEEEVRDALSGDDLLWRLDPDSGREALERLGDALATLPREIAERPPPPSLVPFRDALVAYLSWRAAINQRMLIAAELDGWDGAHAAFVADAAAGERLFRDFQNRLARTAFSRQ
ncbi:MAG: hypothetical protein ACRDJE_28430 [Dehalococcoidia bacterium]